MCGIIGINGIHNTQERLVFALKRLEYRGYDSAGVGCLDGRNLQVVKCCGKVSDLEAKLQHKECEGKIGIAHTRWATHGKVTENNAHPHFTRNVAIVHNGIIENFAELKKELVAENNVTFQTNTDSEVIAKLFDWYISKGFSLLQAAIKINSKLLGSYAVIAISETEPGVLLAMCSGTPLTIGCSVEESFVGSDAYSIAPFVNNATFLKDDDIAVVGKGSFTLYDKNGLEVKRKKYSIDTDANTHSKGNAKYFMHKEIHEEPRVVRNVLDLYVKNRQIDIRFPKDFNVSGVKKITIIACGTSYYAALTAKYWLENVSLIETNVELASEFRTRKKIFVDKNTLGIFISQSGETADTLEALKILKTYGVKIISLTNVEHSAIAREADIHLPIFAGPEIGVASTKAYINQLVVLALISIQLAYTRESCSKPQLDSYINSITRVDNKIKLLLQHENHYKQLAIKVSSATSALFIGRSYNLPIALEGALKLKELSYIHAEGLAGGELKHGPIALIDEEVPLFAIAPKDETFTKMASNIQSVAARKGQVILLSNKQGAKELQDIIAEEIIIEDTDIFTTPICYVVPLQLIAYHAALFKGLNVDQPRNLAKSVTVE